MSYGSAQNGSQIGYYPGNNYGYNQTAVPAYGYGAASYYNGVR
jgi:hypothetical protein